jgi:hypothetical protein
MPLAMRARNDFDSITASGAASSLRLAVHHLTGVLPALRGVLENAVPTSTIHDAPFFDFLKGSKASQTDQIIVQAAISYARRLSGIVHVTHWHRPLLRGYIEQHPPARIRAPRQLSAPWIRREGSVRNFGAGQPTRVGRDRLLGNFDSRSDTRAAAQRDGARGI